MLLAHLLPGFTHPVTEYFLDDIVALNDLELSPDSLTRIRARNFLGEFAVASVPAASHEGGSVAMAVRVPPLQQPQERTDEDDMAALANGAAFPSIQIVLCANTC